MDPYIGEIRMFAGNYVPEDWLLCDGSLQPINTYQTLYSLLGTTYGGDGATTFGLPDLRGRLPVGQGTGPSLTPRTLAQTGGASFVQLIEANLPAHAHTVNTSTTSATTPTVAANVGLAQPQTLPAGQVVRYVPPGLATPPTQQNMDPDTVSVAAGGNQPHSNLMPYLAINYIICPNGLYPQRP